MSTPKDQLMLAPEPEPTPPPSAIRARLQDCDLHTANGTASLVHRTIPVTVLGPADDDPAELLAAMQTEIDRLDRQVSWIGGMQVRGAGLVPGLLPGGGE